MDYYELLGIKKSASARKLSQSYAHIQKNIDARLSVEEKIRYRQMTERVKEAYLTLSNTQSRDAYDSALNSNTDVMLDEFETRALKNLQDTTVVFTANEFGGSYNMPKFCCCCLGPWDGVTHTASASYYSGLNQTTTIKLKFPICVDCCKHMREAHWRRLFVFIISALSAGVFSLLLKIIPVGVAISIIIFFILSSRIKVQKLSVEHTCRMGPVKLISSHVIQFRNWTYAKVFSEMNSGAIKEKHKAKRSHLESLLDVIHISDFLVFLFLDIIVIFFSSLLMSS